MHGERCPGPVSSWQSQSTCLTLTSLFNIRSSVLRENLLCVFVCVSTFGSIKRCANVSVRWGWGFVVSHSYKNPSMTSAPTPIRHSWSWFVRKLTNFSILFSFCHSSDILTISSYCTTVCGYSFFKAESWPLLNCQLQTLHLATRQDGTSLREREPEHPDTAPS